MPKRRIGILGGSFNPPHAGHLQMAKEAYQRLNLNEVWLLVSPHNPLKEKSSLVDFSERVKLCQNLAKGHKNWLKVSEIENTFTSNYTYQTLRMIKSRNKGTDFIWLMGADNLANFHKWQHYDRIIKENKIAIFRRNIEHTSSQNTGLKTPAATKFANLRARNCEKFSKSKQWGFLFVRPNFSSSTAIREAK